jgi:hypothetical protein
VYSLYLEELMIAIVSTQYWDPTVFKEVYPRAYEVHCLMNQLESVKRFIIGRQFFTVLTNFLRLQIFTFVNWKTPELIKFSSLLDEIRLVGMMMMILAFVQLLSESLAAEYSLRFMNIYGSYLICSISLFFDSPGLDHSDWTIYLIVFESFLLFRCI